MRPFSSPVELNELDEVFDLSKEHANTSTVTFEKGCTRRQAMACVHHRMSTLLKCIHLEAQREHVRNGEERTRKSACLAAVHNFTDPKTEADPLGLENPLRVPKNIPLLHHKVETVYAATIDRIRERERKKEAEPLYQKTKKQRENSKHIIRQQVSIFQAKSPRKPEIIITTISFDEQVKSYVKIRGI